jgi:hypothetical protein
MLSMSEGTFIIAAGLIAAFLSGNCIFGAFGSETKDTEYCFYDMVHFKFYFSLFLLGLFQT